MKVDLDEGFYDNRRRRARRATGQYERDDDGKMTLVNGAPVPITEPMTLADLFIEALADQADEREPAKEKLRRARLSDLMLDGGTVELTPGDVALIQKRAGVNLTSTAYLRVVEVLGDPDAESGTVDPNKPELDD